MLTVAHLSDLHIDGSSDRYSRAQAVFRHVSRFRHRVDAVLITGDLTESGTSDQYRTVSSLVDSLDVPVLLVPGNHDSREAFRSLVGGAGTGPVNRIVSVGPVTLVLCDSVVPGSPEGNLADVTLAWLEDTLAATSGPVLLALHHSPAPLHLRALDRMALTNPEDLAAILRRAPHVIAVLCGHAHTAAATTFAGVPVRVAPGVASTAMLQVEVGDEYVMRADAPVMLAVHVYRNATLATHYRVVR